jgi:phytanoyl-CoA hydroxylase
MLNDAGFRLSEEQVESYQNRGYLIIENFWGQEQASSLNTAISSVLDRFDGGGVRCVFGSDGYTQPGAGGKSAESRQLAEEYFLGSGRENNIRYFWEGKAFDSESGAQILPDAQSINKIHNLHDLEPAFRAPSYDSRLFTVCQQLHGMTTPVVVQSMYLFKQASIGGAFSAHQDGSFLFTTENEKRQAAGGVMGCWWPLGSSACSTENGCLWVLPGSHKKGVIRRLRRKGDRRDTDGCEFVRVSDGMPQGYPDDGYEGWDLSCETGGAVPLEVKTGSLVVLHDAVVHFSKPNTSTVPRPAYSIHIADISQRWSPSNWLQRGGAVAVVAARALRGCLMASHPRLEKGWSDCKVVSSLFPWIFDFPWFCTHAVSTKMVPGDSSPGKSCE